VGLNRVWAWNWGVGCADVGRAQYEEYECWFEEGTIGADPR
jgi:hypothetical protein